MKESLPAATLAHRHRIGGLWDELGRLQVEFLRRQGVRQDTKLLDVGCGCLRGGIHFVRFLDPDATSASTSIPSCCAPDSRLCTGSPWDARYVGEWNHPRAQRMARFDRRP